MEAFDKKIKISELIEVVYQEERVIFLDPEIWVDNTEEEKKTALFDFDASWNSVNTVEDLVDVLGDLGFDQDEAYTRILNVIIEA
jgi:hypothetical protein